MAIKEKINDYHEERRKQAMLRLFAQRPKMRAKRERRRQASLTRQEHDKERLAKHYAPIAEILSDQQNHLLLVSNFYGEKARAQTIAGSMAELAPKDAHIGFSVHLSEERIHGGVGNVIEDFESNAI